MMHSRMFLGRVNQAVNPFADATLAFSLRSLGINPTKNKIEAFRVANNDIEVFNANQIQNTNDIQSWGGASDVLVKTWFDESDLNNHASQPDELIMPKIYDSVTGLVLENGKPALSFNGGNLLFGNDNGNLNNIRQGEFTYTAVARNTSLDRSWNAVLSLASSLFNGEGALGIQFYVSLNRFGFHNTWTAATQLALVGVNSIITSQLLIFQTRDNTGINGNGSNVTNSINNLPKVTDIQTWSSNTGNIFIIGNQQTIITTATYPWQGTIQEVIAQPINLQSSENIIKNNINSFYNVI